MPRQPEPRQWLLAAALGGSVLLSGQSQAVEAEWVQPGVYAQLDFGQAQKPAQLRLGAQMKLSPECTMLARERRDEALAYLKLELDPAQGYSLHMLGAPVAGYRFAARATPDLILRQNGEGSEESGSWFSRHWWKVGLGVLAAGAAVASGGGGDSDDNEGDDDAPGSGGPRGVNCDEDGCLIPCGSLGPVITCNN